MVPVIHAVLDLDKIKNFLADKPSPIRQKVGGWINALVRGENNGLIDAQAAQGLLDFFGPKGEYPAILTEIRNPDPNLYPHIEERVDGTYAGYYVFGNLQERKASTLEDMKEVVSFEADITPKKEGGVDIELKNALGGPQKNFIAFFFHTCCQKDDDLPLSSLAVFHTSKGMAASVKNTISARDKHGENVLMTRDEEDNLIVAYNPANEWGLKVLHGRVQHVRQESHDCGSHPTLSANSTTKPSP